MNKIKRYCEYCKAETWWKLRESVKPRALLECSYCKKSQREVINERG